MPVLLLLAAAIAGGPSPTGARGVPSNPADVRQTWLGLPDSANACPDVYDYFPEGGMRVFWCHVASTVSLSAIRDLVGEPIFLSGPHSADALDLNHPTAFGHYNPAFVVRAADVLVPTDPASVRALQPVHDRVVAPLASIHLLVYNKLFAPENATCMEEELAGYQRAMATGAASYERWFWFMNPAFCQRNEGGGPFDDAWYFDNGFDGGVSGNVVKTVVGFWLRRHLDGTRDEFHHALVRLIETYDPGPAAREGR